VIIRDKMSRRCFVKSLQFFTQMRRKLTRQCKYVSTSNVRYIYI